MANEGADFEPGAMPPVGVLPTAGSEDAEGEGNDKRVGAAILEPVRAGTEHGELFQRCREQLVVALVRLAYVPQSVFGLGRSHRKDGNNGSRNPLFDSNGLFNCIFIEGINSGRHAFAFKSSRFGIDLDIGRGRSLLDASDDVHVKKVVSLRNVECMEPPLP